MEISFHLNSRKANSLFSLVMISEMTDEGKGLAKTHSPLKDEAVASIDNKINVMEVLFQSLQIYCTNGTFSVL